MPSFATQSKAFDAYSIPPVLLAQIYHFLLQHRVEEKNEWCVHSFFFSFNVFISSRWSLTRSLALRGIYIQLGHNLGDAHPIRRKKPADGYPQAQGLLNDKILSLCDFSFSRNDLGKQLFILMSEDWNELLIFVSFLFFVRAWCIIASQTSRRDDFMVLLHGSDDSATAAISTWQIDYHGSQSKLTVSLASASKFGSVIHKKLT